MVSNSPPDIIQEKSQTISFGEGRIASQFERRIKALDPESKTLHLPVCELWIVGLIDGVNIQD